jgi:hypothetical protein
MRCLSPSRRRVHTAAGALLLRLVDVLALGFAEALFFAAGAFLVVDFLVAAFFGAASFFAAGSFAAVFFVALAAGFLGATDGEVALPASPFFANFTVPEGPMTRVSVEGRTPAAVNTKDAGRGHSSGRGLTDPGAPVARTFRLNEFALSDTGAKRLVELGVKDAGVGGKGFVVGQDVFLELWTAGGDNAISTRITPHLDGKQGPLGRPGIEETYLLPFLSLS